MPVEGRKSDLSLSSYSTPGSHMSVRILSVVLAAFVCLVHRASAQYISTCETVPFQCPLVCAGGNFTVKVFQVQRLPNGAQVQGELSDASGNFGAGSQILPVSAYSTNGGSSYTPGPYIFRGDVSDLFARFVIPAATTPGSNYNFRIRSSSGYAAQDNFRCPGNGRIAVMTGGTPLPPVPQDAQGSNQWIGHVYTWTPTTSAQLTTDPLVSAQTFFAPGNYQGHVLYDSLNLDLSFSTTGGIPGSTGNGTSLACGNSFQTNFSLRLRRRQSFAPGYYNFSIAGDDGIRFSLDGGATWLLSSFYDQLYSNSIRTTPTPICLSGSVDLVIEYFQHPQDARLTFTATRVSAPLAQPRDVSVCEGIGQVQFDFGNADAANQYRWQVSTDNGGSFTDLADVAPYSGTSTRTLSLANPTTAQNGYLYRCLLSNGCLSRTPSNTAVLRVAAPATITGQPQRQDACPGQAVQFSVAAVNASSYQWQADPGTGFADVPEGSLTGTQTATLTLSNPTEAQNGWRFRCVLTSFSPCNTPLASDAAGLSILNQAQISQIPQDRVLCDALPVTFTVASPQVGARFRWQASSDGGATWSDLTDSETYMGTQTATLSAFTVSADTVLLRAVVKASCGTDALSPAAKLSRCCAVANLSNILTPNDDGLNDDFATYTCALEAYSLKVYNRWGREVYTSTSPAQGWDGAGLPSGVYYYRIVYRYQGHAAENKGTVELVR